MKYKRISWDTQAINFFRDVIAYIKKDSSQNANKVKEEVLKKIMELSEQPEIYAPDKYKLNNKGEYRAFEIYHFRISYLIKEEEVYIARVRNSKQKPLDY